MDPFPTNPLVAVLLDIPVRLYMGFVQGFGIALAFKIILGLKIQLRDT